MLLTDIVSSVTINGEQWKVVYVHFSDSRGGWYADTLKKEIGIINIGPVPKDEQESMLIQKYLFEAKIQYKRD